MDGLAAQKYQMRHVRLEVLISEPNGRSCLTVDWVGGGDLDMIGVRVCGGALFIDPVMLDINPIVDYIAFEKAKGKEGFLHGVVHHIASFVESEVYVQFSNKPLCKGVVSGEDGRGVS